MKRLLSVMTLALVLAGCISDDFDRGRIPDVDKPTPPATNSVPIPRGGIDRGRVPNPNEPIKPPSMTNEWGRTECIVSDESDPIVKSF